MKLLKNIFSITNKRDYKVVTILGLKLSFSRFKMQKIRSFNNNKPTIAFQLNQMDKGGLEEVVLQLATNEKIREKYNTVIISEFSNKGYLVGIAKAKEVPVYSFFKNYSRIEKLIKKLNIKIAHFHYNLAGIEEYKNQGVKTLYTIHNNYIWMNDDDVRERNRSYLYVDKFIAVSSQVKEYFCEKFSIEDNKVEVIPNGIEYFDTSKILPMAKTFIGFDENDFVMLNVASFNPNKYHFSQIKALSNVVSKYKNIKLLLIGNVQDKIYFQKVNDMIKDLHLEDKVKILDFVPKEDIYKYLKMADCFVMTSLTEGFSIAMSEAMLFNKPLILTDVGGARDVINNNDIGIIVPHAFKNIQGCNVVAVEEDYKNNIYHFENIDKISNAIESMYLDKETWTKKAQVGSLKIKEYFNLDRVLNDYLEKFDSINFEVDKNYIKEQLQKENFEVAILAPYPAKAVVNEGWMSRIAAIDKIISNKKRIYINPFMPKAGINWYKRSENEYELQINNTHPDFYDVLGSIIANCSFLYCHTLHMAEYILPFLDSGKIIVDIHGVTPEEEVMLGHPHLKEKYEKIEQEVLKKAKYCVMVSNAMKIHYKNKYPDISFKNITLPIVEKIDIDRASVSKAQNQEMTIVYSGATQVWQNVDAMLNLNTVLDDFMKFIYLSNDCESIKKKANKLKIKNAVFDCVLKDELKKIYKKANFGLMLRDESSVNFVACPTKLYDYFACGIIPVVRTEKIGDFLELGYKFVKEEDLINKILPTKEEQENIIQNNFEVVDKLRSVFEKGSRELQEVFNGVCI